MIEHQETVDFSRVPVSQGLNRGTLMVIFSGVVMIFIVGGLSIYFAGYGHMWPSTHSERMPLGKMPNGQ